MTRFPTARPAAAALVLVAAVATALAAAVAATPAGASQTRLWSASRAPELARGTLDGTQLDEEGVIRLAPPLRNLWGPGEGIVWAVAPDGAGGAFVALSGPGRVLRARAGGEVETWWDGGDDALVTALAPDGDGGVYVGLAPEGSVLHLAGPERIAREYDVEGSFVWSLDVGADGTLWAGTGNPGAVLARRGPEREGAELEPVYATGEDPVRVVRAVDGGALAGTGGQGHVVRLALPARGAASAYVAYDADEDEIVGVAAGEDGTLFALAAAGAKRVATTGGDDPAERTSSNYVRVTATPPPGGGGGGDGGGGDGGDAGGDGETAAAGAAAQAAARRAAQRLSAAAGGTLYRIEPSGAVRALWQAGTNTPFALERAADGRLLVATGDAGHVFAVDDEGTGTRLLRIPSNQVSALALEPDGALLAGGSGDARVERIGAGARDEGAYRTPAIDAGTPARWGRLRWRAEIPRGGAVDVAVRVGNTEEPGEAWTDWAPVERRDGDAYVPAALPAARRLQVRFTLRAGRDGSPSVAALEAAYRPGNRPPVAADLEVQEPGVVWTRVETSSASAGGPFVADDPVTREVAEGLRRGRGNGGVRRVFEPGMRTFSWKAEDPDGDRLRFALELRAEGADAWLPLADGLEDPFWSWDSRAVPDGLYRARLTASDAADRPADAAREHRVLSDVFRIDHTRPRIEGWSVEPRRGGGAVATFVARDEGGALAAVEWSAGDGPWRPLASEDGLVDGPVERFRLEVGAGPVRVRATDRAGNVGGTQATVQLPSGS